MAQTQGTDWPVIYTMNDSSILTVSDLSVRYDPKISLFSRRGSEDFCLRHINLTLYRGKILGIVGESGSGKTTLAKSLVGLIKPKSGSIRHQQKIQFVFQDPHASLNPGMTIEQVIMEPLLYTAQSQSKPEMQRRLREVCDEVGLDYSQRYRFPHEFSGGQCQRIAIARAIIARPDILICDEPVSALDVSVRAQVINLLAGLNRRYGMSMIFISHDLWLTRKFSHDLLVLYHGSMVETGPTAEVFSRPRHPYTQALIRAIPVADPHVTPAWNNISIGARSGPVSGEGCIYLSRCPVAGPECEKAYPALTAVGQGVEVACFKSMDDST